MRVNSQPHKTPPSKTPIISKAWLLYFLFSIAGLGSFFAYVFAAPLYLLGRLWSPAGRLGDRILLVGVRVLMNTQPWLTAKIELHIPNPRQRTTGLLLVSNHRSHLDSFLLLSRVEGVRILAKKSLFFVPLLGMMMRLMRQIPTKRGQVDSFWKAIETMRDRLAAGEVVHVFPEMTRCAPGFVGTQSFSAAAFLPAMRAQVPVIPIAFTGTDAAWPKGSFGIWARRPITAKVLDPIDPRGFTSAEALRDEARRRIDNELRKLHDSSNPALHPHLQQ